MEFEKTITTKYRADWIRQEFLPYDETFRKARARMRTKMSSCFKCRHKFNDGEMMALASFGSKGNKVLCRNCAVALKEVQDDA